MCWKSWHKVFQTKERGDLGFGIMELFNKMLLTKQLRKLVINKESLLHKCLKTKYIPNNNILDTRHNYVWQSIIKTKDNILNGCCWRIRDGRNIKMWTDPRIPYQGWVKVITWKPLDSNVFWVRDLLEEGAQKMEHPSYWKNLQPLWQRWDPLNPFRWQ